MGAKVRYVNGGALTSALLCLLLLIAAHAAQAQTETVLYNFTGNPDGSESGARLTPDGNGNFYGTTGAGGTAGYGTVFEISPNGENWTETVLYSFCPVPGCLDGKYPFVSYVLLDQAGNLYGTAQEGGSNNCGVVFELSRSSGHWIETVLHNFAGGVDGCYPVPGLIMDQGGNLYGTTETANSNLNGVGTVFELSPSGGGWTEKVIYSGYEFANAGLTVDSAGNIFGLGLTLKPYNWVVFELLPNGNGGWSSSVLHTFARGFYPYGTLALDPAGNLYGTTVAEGAHNGGTVYRLTPEENGQWKEKVLYSFDSQNGGGYAPYAGVVLDSAGNVYGTTRNGGMNGVGTVFELVAPFGKTKTYEEKTLWNFNETNGATPDDSLILDGAGSLYGTTQAGGVGGSGVVFEVTP